MLNWSTCDDKLLVGYAQKGHAKAFSELVRRHHMRIFHTAFGMVGNREDADDLAQLAFIKAFQSLHQFRGQSLFSTWLYRISINCCLDWIKSQQRKYDVKMDDEWWFRQADSEALFAGPKRTDYRVEQGELRDVLTQVLADMPPIFRSVLVLRELNGLSYQEIASVEGCSVGTVKSRLFRARAQLRKLLRPFYKALVA